MKLKKEYLILIVVIVALGLYLTMKSANDNDETLPQPDKLESAKINRLIITDQGATIELEKKDEQWFVEPAGYKADKAKAQNMVKALAEITLTALVSESGNYERYGLSADEKTVVKAYSEGKEVRALDIGKAAPTFQHTFVKLEGDPNVYHAMGQMERTFDQTVENLRDKTIFEADKERITTISFKKGDQTLSLTKKEVLPEKAEVAEPKAEDQTSTEAEPKSEQETAPPTPEIQWQDADGNAMDKDTVERLIGGIAKLSCDGFAEDQTKENLKDPVWTVAFNDGEKDYAISVFAKADAEAAQMTATASGVDYAFELNKYRVDTFEKSIKKLLGIEEDKTKK